MTGVVPRLLYEGEPTLLYADGDTGKPLVGLTLAAAVHSGTGCPAVSSQRAVPTAYLDWETSQDTL
jgi:AAA domain-containing protein